MPRVPPALRPFSALRAFRRRLHNPDLAALGRMVAGGSDLAVLQPWTTSSEERYPALFDAVAGAFADRPDPRILSFGCAGGEEVRAHRRRLPDATIVGVDVNPRALERARRRDRNPLSCYLIGDRPPPGAPFDAALALAVFRHGEIERHRPDTCTPILPFAAAAATFAPLDAAIAPGGYLGWGHAHFRLADLPGGANYELVDTCGLEPSTCLYGSDGFRVEGTGPAGLFRKRA
ncbi:class I SAM-dependent methyltransferase [Tsuneonella amylolytica]|uniref:class I SAM-dependent methyltransferase n=1 Tax=Tsuneonella amylolytica TaxID=2338327 RepID=UPI000EA8DEEA|nr:methyltransferase domain-containing protein [Tsuneonella amylolytica]